MTEKPVEKLTEFLTAWKDKNFQGMFNACQETWKFNHEKDGIQWIDTWYGIKNLISWNIIDSKISGVVRDIKIEISYKDFAFKGKYKTITARLVCETAPFKPDINGDWGVNPISALREEISKAKDVSKVV